MTDFDGKPADFSDFVHDVMKNQSPENGTLTVYEVNECLELITKHFNENEPERECEK